MHALKPIFAALALGGFVLSWSGPPAPAEPGTKAPAGWTAAAPRDEIRPAFAFEPTGGPDGAGV